MLFEERITAYCENQTEQTDTLCGQNVEIVHHRNYFVSSTNPNRLILFRGNCRCLFLEPYGTQIHCVGRMQRLYLTGNTLRLHYKAQPLNAVWGISRC
jgi:hypothetical protein